MSSKSHRNDSDGRSGKPPRQRQLRVGEVIRHELSQILTHGGFHDPDLQGRIITVPEVRMARDLKTANVFIMPLGGSGEKEVINALNRNKKRIRGLLSQKLTLKFMPGLSFELDRSFQASRKIDDLLRSPEVSRDLGKDPEGQQ